MPSTEDKYAPKAWAEAEYDFVLPSGDTCLLRKLDPLVLTEYGLVDKLDFATSVVVNKHQANANLSNVERIKRDRARQEGKLEEESEVATGILDALGGEEAAKNSRDFREVLNQVMILGVVAPVLSLPPEPGKPRVRGLFYVDGVPFSDKMAVFKELMKGVRSVEQFLEKPEETVGVVAPEPGVRAAPKRAPRARKRPAS